VALLCSFEYLSANNLCWIDGDGAVGYKVVKKQAQAAFGAAQVFEDTFILHLP